MGFEPTTNGLEGRRSTTELRPRLISLLPRGGHWAEMDSNHRRLSHQIYSLTRLTTSVPTRAFGHLFPSSREQAKRSPLAATVNRPSPTGVDRVCNPWLDEGWTRFQPALGSATVSAYG